MSNGIIILCMKKQQYACAAFNLALSIRYHSPDAHITLLSDGIHNKVFGAAHFLTFNSIKEIKEQTVTEAKLSLSKYSDYKQSLYIDADSICLQDIMLLFDKLKGNSFKSNVLPNYTQWTDEETFKSFFKQDFGVTINSSWMYWESSKVFTSALKYFSKGFDLDKISPKWGVSLPDEMFLNASLTKNEIDAKINFDLMFFDEKKQPVAISELSKNFYFATFYGNKNNTGVDLQEWYDRMMFKICTKYGMEHRFKIHEILVHKLVNDR